MDESTNLSEADGAATLETAAEISARTGIYGEIKRALIARGVPADEIAFIHDFPTPKKKAAAFAACNAGKIRILLASTEKAGTGVNMQELHAQAVAQGKPTARLEKVNWLCSPTRNWKISSTSNTPKPAWRNTTCSATSRKGRGRSFSPWMNPAR